MTKKKPTRLNRYYRVLDLPWSLGAEQQKRYRKIQLRTFAAILLLCLLMPFLPTPEPEEGEVPEIPQRFAKLIIEKKAPPPPPPPPVVEQVAETEPEPEPEPEKEPEPIPEPEPEPVRTVEQARENASKAGVMAFADSLADLRENSVVESVTASSNLAAGAGEDRYNERSLITSRAGSGSAGINTSQLSRNTGGSGLAGRSTTQVASSITAGDGRPQVRRSGESKKGSRSREEIEMVFDKNKGAIYAMYNRALRRDPTLQGKLVLKLTITPAGQVVDCEVVSSELESPDFERKLVARVKLFRFEAKDVETVTTTKPIDFFPA